MKVQITDTIYMKANPSSDPEYAGIWIQIYDGEKEVGAVLVDKTDNEIIGRLWGSEDINGDPVAKTTLHKIKPK